jgi:hypothetical protein
MAVAALLAQRSGPVVENLVAGLDDLVVGFKNNNNTARRRKKKKRRKKRQVMNASFDRWRLVNTYGAFGFVGQMRDEMVIKGTRGNWDAPDEDWKEYDFAVKPGGKRGTMHGSGARKRSSLYIYRAPCIYFSLILSLLTSFVSLLAWSQPWGGACRRSFRTTTASTGAYGSRRYARPTTPATSG